MLCWAFVVGHAGRAKRCLSLRAGSREEGLGSQSSGSHSSDLMSFYQVSPRSVPQAEEEAFGTWPRGHSRSDSGTLRLGVLCGLTAREWPL